ncbi:site-specific integrase [Sphingomonas oligophenolica]|uniref:Tyrosine-type recombinase/integrase n=1 Tax=Sphingomonas oligophenolica TaxID=301154 RepID=A0ABU9Y3E5_9SPHN
MRNADRFDLADLDISTIDLPASGERSLRDSVVPALALRVRSSGSRSWVVLRTKDGKTVRETLGDAVSVPLASARLMASGPVVAKSPIKEITEPDERLFKPAATVADMLPRFLTFGANGRWKPSTGRQMESVGRTCILPLLGDRKLQDITPQDVACWHRDVTAQTSSARMALSTLSGLMLFAEDHGVRPAGSNPCRGLRKKAKGHRGRHLPPGSVKRLWAALDRLHGRMPDYCDAVRLLLLTGARRSEVLGLQWDLIAGPRAVLEDSKSGPRTIWLNAPAREILDARRAASASLYVFPSPRIDGPLTAMDAPWRAILKEAGLSGMRLHDLRHHFASVAVSNGIDIRLVGQLLGHRDIDSTLGYAHLATGALTKSASRVSSIIDRSMNAGATPKPRHQCQKPTSRSRRALAAAVASSGEARHA